MCLWFLCIHLSSASPLLSCYKPNKLKKIQSVRISVVSSYPLPHTYGKCDECIARETSHKLVIHCLPLAGSYFSLVKCWEMLLNISASRRSSFPSHLQPPASSENSANTLWDKLAVHLGALSSFHLQWTPHRAMKALVLSPSYNCFLFLLWPSSELMNILRKVKGQRFSAHSGRTYSSLEF